MESPTITDVKEGDDERDNIEVESSAQDSSSPIAIGDDKTNSDSASGVGKIDESKEEDTVERSKADSSSPSIIVNNAEVPVEESYKEHDMTNNATKISDSGDTTSKEEVGSLLPETSGPPQTVTFDTSAETTKEGIAASASRNNHISYNSLGSIPPRCATSGRDGKGKVMTDAFLANFLPCCNLGYSNITGVTAEDQSAIFLSHIGKAAYNALSKKHGWYHHMLWNVTSGKVVGQLDQTPMTGWKSVEDPPERHDDWFPKKMREIMCRTEYFCDVMSLSPPDGLFMDEFKAALKELAEKAKGRDHPIIVRMMFGSIVGMPVNCDKVIKTLTQFIDESANIQLWVGAWRKGASWNHAKIIAVDGHFLHTGGHNLWDRHYLKKNPVHDLSIELEGRVTYDGHRFANEQWSYIKKKQSTIAGRIIDKLPDNLILLKNSRVTVSEFPIGKAAEFPPKFRDDLVPKREKPQGNVPIISMGRYGLLKYKSRPSDDAFLAMFDAAESVIKLAIQDLGPVTIPGTKLPLPGLVWPKAYMSAIGRAIWKRGVHVKIALSNPRSLPDGLGITAGGYGNGWSCVDCASEIIKTVTKQFPEADDVALRKAVSENLQVCFIKEKCGKTWKDGTTMGMHAKHFIIDDTCCYIGSQNLYICDLAEWGVVIDSLEETKKIMDEYFTPMWEFSYRGEDCDVDEVMDGLKINRDAEHTLFKPLKKFPNGGLKPTESIDLYDTDQGV